MSTLSKEQIHKIAKLSRIRLSEDEVDFYANEVAKIIAWVEKLSEVDTENVPALFSVNQNLKMFPDEVDAGDLSNEILSNSPGRQFDFYAVPKVIE